jgi:hypothetical protein
MSLDKDFSYILGEDLFVKFPFIDFASLDREQYSFQIFSKEYTVSIKIPNKEKLLKELCGKLNVLLSESNNIFITWNFKNFLSYVAYITKSKFKIDPLVKIFDLEVLENHFDIRLESPDNFHDAFDRFKNVVKDDQWNNLKDVYNSVYKKLVLDVIPFLETRKIIFKGEVRYSNYEIATQINGRMKSNGSFRKGINVHNLSVEDKEYIKPSMFDSVFIYADYKHMEPTVLQWLSEDANLLEVSKNGDLYESIWEDLTGMKADENFRSKCKSIFLPVIFGLQSKSLAEKLNLQETTAKKLILKIEQKYKKSIEWLKSQNTTNMFGRKRNIDSDKDYLIRSFIIQSISSLFCLIKLIKIYESFENDSNSFLTMHIHDGYVLTSKISDILFASDKITKIMEEEEPLFEGLSLKTSLKFGKNLNNLRKVYNEEYE